VYAVSGVRSKQRWYRFTFLPKILAIVEADCWLDADPSTTVPFANPTPQIPDRLKVCEVRKTAQPDEEEIAEHAVNPVIRQPRTSTGPQSLPIGSLAATLDRSCSSTEADSWRLRHAGGT